MYRSARNVIQSTLIHSSRKSKPRRICSKSTNTSSRSEKDPISSTVPPPSSSSQSAQGPISWKALAVFGTVGTAGLLYYSREKQRRMEAILKPKTVGKAAIGGPFQLVDKAGKPVTEQYILGRWTLIYFGFTMCPDICPEELTKVTEALQILQKHGKKVGESRDASISPIFITVDPERDTPGQADEYAKNFHPAFLGIGGTMDQVKATAKAYRVYFSKDETPGDEYLVDHSIITYLMDPKGEFSEFYGKNTSAVEMASRIEAKMLEWKD